MKANNVFPIFGFIFSLSVWGQVVPEYVQVPTSFNSQEISTQTSRYFFQNVSTSYFSNETFVMGFQNTGTVMVRVSAIGAYISGACSGIFRMYKGLTLNYTDYSPISNSTLELTTASTSFSGGTQVYQLQIADGASQSGPVSQLSYIPKELYSVTIAPGETLAITVSNAIGIDTNISTIIMWEEIIAN